MEYLRHGKIPHAKGSAIGTMTKDDIQLLHEYDRWANRRMQLAFMMRQLNVEAGATDFYLFLVEGRGATSPAT